MIAMKQHPLEGRLRNVAVLAVFLAFCLAGHARAADKDASTVEALSEAEHLFVAGRYDEVIEVLREQPGADASAMAARALLTKAMLMRDKDPAILPLASAALTYSEAALQEAPDMVEAHLHTALALGLQAEHLPLTDAITNVEAARNAIDTALRLAPDNPWALSVNAGWHLTLTGRLGAGAASLLFSASRSRGLADFRRARSLTPDNPALLYHFAKVRVLQGDGEALPEARQALFHLMSLKPRTALGRSLQKMAPRMLAEIDAIEDEPALPGDAESP